MRRLPSFLSGLTNVVPLACKYPLKVTPKFVQRPVLTMFFNQVFAHFLQDDELDFLENKVLRIVVADIDYQLDITVINQKIIVLDHAPAIDVTLSANFNELVLMIARYEDPDTLFFHRKLSIEGDTAIGLGVKNWLDGMDMDILPKWCQTLLQHYAAAIQQNTRALVVNS